MKLEVRAFRIPNGVKTNKSALKFNYDFMALKLKVAEAPLNGILK